MYYLFIYLKQGNTSRVVIYLIPHFFKPYLLRGDFLACVLRPWANFYTEGITGCTRETSARWRSAQGLNRQLSYKTNSTTRSFAHSRSISFYPLHTGRDSITTSWKGASPPSRWFTRRCRLFTTTRTPPVKSEPRCGSASCRDR